MQTKAVKRSFRGLTAWFKATVTTPRTGSLRSEQRPPERAMGSSTKRKNEKRKDFKKPKLKVGKARSKPDNFTDTSFKAKGRHMLKIHVKAQMADSDRSYRPCSPVPHYYCPHSIPAILPPPIPSLLPLIVSTTRLSCLPYYSYHLSACYYTPPTACQRPPTEIKPFNTGRQP